MTHEKLTWTTVTRKVRDLKLLSYNPRKLTDKNRQKLIASLEKFDVVEIPVIDTDDTVIAGNQRVTVLKDLGQGDREIDCRIPNRPLTEQEIKDYNIRSNTHVGIWDVEVLEEVFSDIDLGEFDIDAKAVIYTPPKEEPEKKKIKPLKKSHVLLSFPIEKFEEIKPFLEEILKVNEVEYEHGSN